MERNKGGRARQAAELVQRTGERNWYIRFYDEQTRQTRHVSTGTADRQTATIALTNLINKQTAASEKPTPRVLPAQLPPGAAKVRGNQNLGRDAHGHRIERQPLAQRKIPDDESAKKAFSQRMREARIAAKLSQTEVVQALFGHDTPTKTYWKRYQNWEIGRSPMALEVIPVFAKLVGVDCNFLFGHEEQR